MTREAQERDLMNRIEQNRILCSLRRAPLPVLGAHRFFDANQSQQIGVRHWLVCQKLFLDENVPHHQSMTEGSALV